MCQTEIWKEVRPTGETYNRQRTELCRKSRNGRVCENEEIFHIGTSPQAAVTYTARPPTPRHTPSSSTSSIPHTYNNNNDADAAAGPSRSPKRSSGVYVNGTKVLDIKRSGGGSGGRADGNRTPERRDRHHGHSGTERIVIVDHPPTPRTPPTPYAVPYTAPPSPIAGGAYVNVVDATRGPRPLIVDERATTLRPRVEIQTVTVNPQKQRGLDIPHRSSGHHRRSASNGSNASSNAVSGEELRRQVRFEERERDRDRDRDRVTRADRIAAEHELREQRRRREIQLHNEQIAARAVPHHQPAAAAAAATAYVPPVVLPPTPPPTHAAPYHVRRTSTGVAAGPAQAATAQLRDAVRQLDIGEQLARERAQREEEREQARRLRERMTPARRATVGHGGRRHRVVYDDGMWRWE